MLRRNFLKVFLGACAAPAVVVKALGKKSQAVQNPRSIAEAVKRLKEKAAKHEALRLEHYLWGEPDDMVASSQRFFESDKTQKAFRELTEYQVVPSFMTK